MALAEAMQAEVLGAQVGGRLGAVGGAGWGKRRARGGKGRGQTEGVVGV